MFRYNIPVPLTKHSFNNLCCFSFGVMVWELLTRKLPYSEDSSFGASVHSVQLLAAYMGFVNPHCLGLKVQLMQQISAGRRPIIPAGTPKVLATLIEMCWAADPMARYVNVSYCPTRRALYVKCCLVQTFFPRGVRGFEKNFCNGTLLFGMH